MYINIIDLDSIIKPTADFLENDSYWKNSYYLMQHPFVRLSPCLTLDPPETKLSSPKKSMVMGNTT